jgi:thioredoxin-like negative regulator of GroEL
MIGSDWLMASALALFHQPFAVEVPFMIRFARQFLVAAAALSLNSLAIALEVQPYQPDTLIALQSAGKPVAVHFHADWCSTCAKQSKSLAQLQSEGQLKGMTVLVAEFGKVADLQRQHKVRSQSVLIVFKGTQEVERIAGRTQPEQLQQALAKAL